MKIIVLTVGKIKPDWLRKGVEEYRDRISRYQGIDIVQIPDAPETLDLNKALETEGAKILAGIKHTDYVVMLDPLGEQSDSPELAGKVRSWLESGRSALIFVIGGSNGFSKEVCQRADEKISLSALTFPHQLARLIFLEQLYRCLKINRGEKYHK